MKSLNKKGGIGRWLLPAFLVLMVIFGIVAFQDKSFAALANGLFGWSLGLEAPGDDEAKDNLDSGFISSLIDCKTSTSVGCFCDTSDTFSFPNQYELVFSLDGSRTKVRLLNNLGGIVSEKVITGIIPCSVDELGGIQDLSKIAKDSKVSIVIGSSSFMNYESLSGEEISYPVNGNNLILKRDKGSFCIVDSGFPTKPVCG